MRVQITDINGPLEAIFAAGLKEILVIDGVTVDCPSSPGFPPFPASSEREAAVVAPAPAAPLVQKNKPGRKPKAQVPEKTGQLPKAATQVAKPSTSVEKQEVTPTAEAPRLTIRQRLINMLKQGPLTTSAAAKRLSAVGLGSVDASQHFYLMKRDGLCTQDTESGEYKITPAGADL